MSQRSILIDVLSSAYWKRRKEKGEMARGLYFCSGQTCTIASTMLEFSWLLGEKKKAVLRVSP
jgi:hypothetical protein